MPKCAPVLGLGTFSGTTYVANQLNVIHSSNALLLLCTTLGRGLLFSRESRVPAASCTFPIRMYVCTYVRIRSVGRAEGGECIRLLYHFNIQGAVFVQATIEAGLIPPLVNILQKVSVGGSVWCKYVRTYCQKLRLSMSAHFCY